MHVTALSRARFDPDSQPKLNECELYIEAREAELKRRARESDAP